MNKRGFSIYLTFLVTTVVFMLVTGSQELSLLTLDISRSDAIDVIAFHAADGGLERGLAKLRKNYGTFSFSYISELKPFRSIKVNVAADKSGNQINLTSEAIVMEGNKEVSRRRLTREGVVQSNNRKGSGIFAEVI